MSENLEILQDFLKCRSCVRNLTRSKWFMETFVGSSIQPRDSACILHLSGTCLSSWDLTISLTCELYFLPDNTPCRKNEFVSDSSNEHDKCALLSVQDLNLNSFLFILIRKVSGSVLRQIPMPTKSQLFLMHWRLQAEGTQPALFQQVGE